MVVLCDIPDRHKTDIEDAWGSRLQLKTLEEADLNPHPIDIALASGNGIELKSWLLQEDSDTPRIFSLQKKARRIKVDKMRVHSYLIAHKDVGGVTDAVSKFYVTGCPRLSLQKTVERTIGSVIDYKRYLSLTNNPTEFLQLTDYLPTKSIDMDIEIPTRLSPSGKAYRRLSPAELCTAWDLPRWAIKPRPSLSDIAHIHPLKAGLVLCDQVMQHSRLESDSLGEPPLRNLQRHHEEPTGHYFEDLNVWLPPTWIDSSLITGKAVKVDSAAVPEHLWDRRITLTLQYTNPPLSLLRRRLHARACYNVLLSFFIFMVKAHSLLWLDWLSMSTNQLAFPWFFEALRRALVRFVRVSTRKQGGKDSNEGLTAKSQFSTDANYTTSKFGAELARKVLSTYSTFSTPVTRDQENLTPTTTRTYTAPNKLQHTKYSSTEEPHMKHGIEIALNSSQPGGTLSSRTISTTPHAEIREFTRNLILGYEACLQYSKSTWWKWNNGSTLLFWRWPTQATVKAARDGFPLFMRRDKLPKYKVRHRKISEEMACQMGAKISDVLRKTYIASSARPKSYIDFFGVPKGIGPNGEILDIRIVYNGSSCGLNNAVWAPNFWLPTPNTAIRQMSYGYWVMDLDLGEMFLNFPVPEEIRPYLGVSLDQVADKLKGVDSQIIEHKSVVWTRLLMGFRPSPFFAIKFYYHAEEFILGDRTNNRNPFAYHKVILNLPGMRDFDPRLPWVMKWNEDSDCIAAAIVTFVDDVRASGATSEIVWQAAQSLAKRLQYLGIQHAPRKLRPPSKTHTGAWAGGITEASDSSIFKSITQAKWDRILPIIDRIESDRASSVDDTLEYKQLEKDRGFLVHVAMTYKVMNPHLKGLHQTIDSWRPNRDAEGWKMKARDWTDKLAAISNDDIRNQLIEAHTKGHPTRVKAAKRLDGDLLALRRFFSKKEPTKVSMRANRIFQVNYGFGDASGEGFGDNWLTSSGISYHHGTWSPEVSAQSSNYREFRNVLDSIEREGKAGRLVDAFLIFATDNRTVESALFKGTSDSPKLLSMVIEFHSLQMKYGFEAIITHVSGYRMIKQGGDGLSRGALNEGVMGGASYRSFIPFHLSAINREPKLKELIDRLTKGLGTPTILLEPMDWFQRGHDVTGGNICQDGMWRPTVTPGTYVWDLPPAACDVALEELRKARIKRHDSTHIVLCPRLMTPLWLKQLFKCCDLILEIPPSCDYWNSNMCEPCVIGFCFPYLQHEPWILRGTPKMLQLHRKLSKLWKTDQMGPISILHEFCLVSRRLPKMPRELVRKMLYFEQQD